MSKLTAGNCIFLAKVKQISNAKIFKAISECTNREGREVAIAKYCRYYRNDLAERVTKRFGDDSCVYGVWVRTEDFDGCWVKHDEERSFAVPSPLIHPEGAGWFSLQEASEMVASLGLEDAEEIVIRKLF